MTTNMSGPVGKNRLFGMEIDEISLVDRPANQHAAVLISKADAPEEDAMGYVDADGNPVDENTLEHGDVVYDDSGAAFVYEVEGGPELDFSAFESDEDEDADDREPELVGKSFGSDVLEAISKAVDGDEQKQAIAKAFAVQQEQLEIYKRQAEEAQAWAEREHDTRVTEAFIAKAAEYNLPIAAEVLGPILKKMATVLDESELDIIEKVFTDVGDTMYDEIGYVGTGTNGTDVFSEVSELAKAAVSKAAESGNQITEEDALIAAFESNPAAYTAYQAEMGR
jgi:hypothetical protein